jgi:hypothetical protein
MDYGEALGRASTEGYVLTEIVPFAKRRIRPDIEIKETGYEEEILRTICDDLFLEDFSSHLSLSPPSHRCGG